MLPSLASLEAFELRLPGGISSGHEERAQAALDDASALVRAEAGESWVDDEDVDSAAELTTVPDVIVTVVIAAAKRAFINPDGVRSESIDQHSTTYASPDVFLTKAEKQTVRRAVGRAGVWTKSTTRSEDDIPDIPGIFDSTIVEEYDPLAESWK